MTTHLILPDPHAHPDHNNDRATYAGRLAAELRPDVIIILGDLWDMPSLSSYDKNKRSHEGRRYSADVDAGLDFQDRFWQEVKKTKKKLPRRIFLIGNHEQRIERAADINPELYGTISYRDLDLDRYYDTIIDYNGSTPGILDVDGVSYAHYFVSGVLSRPIGGQHPGYSLVTKKLQSCTQGHTHVYDWNIGTDARGNKVMGLVAGVFQDYNSSYAGEAQKLWTAGVTIKRHVEDGYYEPEFVSLQTLERMYGGKNKKPNSKRPSYGEVPSTKSTRQTESYTQRNNGR